MILIDGSFGEGGGQILRVAVGLAALAKKPIEIINIRMKRDPPGLRPQHLTAVKAVASLVNARVEGLEVGSTKIKFIPGDISSGNFTFDVGTAGSVSLVLQALLPVLAFTKAPINVTLKGGTAVPWSPPITYIEKVLLPLLSRMGLKAEIRIIRHGFYPKGGGIVNITVYPVSQLKPIELIEQGNIKQIKGISLSARLPSHIAERQARSAEKILREYLGNINININIIHSGPEVDNVLSPGTFIVLLAETDKNVIIGSDALGEKGKPAEKVGEEAALKLINEIKSNATVDVHMSDQLIPWMALANGTSKIKVSSFSLHAYTCIYITKQILGGEFKVQGELNKPSIIEVKGIGFTGN
ncbi:MAG: RNA 3'-terminal phosphate cyclase [Thermoprotei archaeon]|jgi:RNA 3'-terminal phosphate cyclase (ATP)